MRIVAIGEVKNVLTFRSVLWDDRDLLLQWRNDAVTRANSITNTVISRPIHEAWLRDSLAEPKRKLMIIEDENLPVGVLRFDTSEDGRVEVSIHLDPASRGKGFGRLALLQCEQLVKQWLPQAHELFARVKRDNASSRRAFAAAGFVETRQTDEIIYFCKQTESPKHC